MKIETDFFTEKYPNAFSERLVRYIANGWECQGITEGVLGFTTFLIRKVKSDEIVEKFFDNLSK